MQNSSPNVQEKTEAQDEQVVAYTGLYQAMRNKYESYFQLTHNKLGLASTQETAALKSWIDSIAPTDKDKILDADKWYRLDYQKRAHSALELYHGKFLPPLQRAVSQGVISADSFNEWVNWIRDRGRDYKEKEASIASTLPDYLQKRYKLASSRESLLRDPRMAGLSNSSDPKLKALAATVSDQSYFLNTLSFSQREKAITEAMAALPLSTEEAKVFESFLKTLDSAQSDGLISSSSRQKWIARFKDPAVNIKAKVYFVSSQFPSYVSAWKKVKEERTKLLADPAIQELTAKECKTIDLLKDSSKFLELHHDRKKSLLAEVRAAKEATAKGKEALHNQTLSILESAASAGYISSNKIGPWLEHVINGNRSLTELKSFVKDWAKVRYRYDKVEMAMVEGKAPQGMQRMPLETFLALSYAQRLSYVNEAEQRLNIESAEIKDTPIQDLKGKVRHALDLEQWAEAEYYLRQAWPVATEQADISELQSMENYLKSFRSEQAPASQESTEEETIAKANQEITTVLNLLPVALQPVYRKAIAKGSGCLQCVTTCVYNRTWCEERGYLNGAMEAELREQSIQETEERVRSGGEGHDHGLENNFVDGYNQPAIRDQGIGPQNLFMSSGGADAFVEKADANKNTFTFWYWTNLVVDGVSSSQNAYASYNLNHRIKSALRTLESHGKRYNPVAVSPASSQNNSHNTEASYALSS